MKTKFALLSAAAVMSLTSLCAQASAVLLPDTLFKFTANCQDCAAALERPSYEVTGELLLRDYLGTGAFGINNFVSFKYSGSNLFDAYEILANDTGLGYVAGDFSEANSYLKIYKTLSNGKNLWFTTDSGVNAWSTGAEFPPADYGNSLVWTRDTGGTGNNVPEPTTLLLVGAALAGISLTRRLKRKPRVKS